MDTQQLENTKQFLINQAITYGPKLLVGILFMVMGSLVAGWVGKAFTTWLEKRQTEPPIRMLLVRLVRLLVFAFFLIMALQNLGVELVPLIAGLGVAGVGIGLALQGVLQNLVAGLLIIFTKPFRVGEYIELLHVHGEVTHIELFSTTLLHADRSRVVIPNRKIIGEILHNYGKIRQLDLTVGVAMDTDLNRAIALVRDVTMANGRVIKEMEPVIAVTQLADFSINIAVKPWVKLPDFGPASGELYQAIVARFRAEGVRIPSPQREVRVIQATA